MAKDQLDELQVLKQMRKLNWKDPDVANYAIKCLTSAWKVKYPNIRTLAGVVAEMTLYQVNTENHELLSMSSSKLLNKGAYPNPEGSQIRKKERERKEIGDWKWSHEKLTQNVFSRNRLDSTEIRYKNSILMDQ